MVHGFIMVKTAAGASEGLLDPIRESNGVTEAHVVAGDWDIIVEADGDEVYDVLQIASMAISGLNGVDDTKTYVALNN
ncbi:MAG: Lrp/AsnC ligand binding domain-containing protein [Halolamina sp.]